MAYWKENKTSNPNNHLHVPSIPGSSALPPRRSGENLPLPTRTREQEEPTRSSKVRASELEVEPALEVFRITGTKTL